MPGTWHPKSFEDLERLPITDKSFLREADYASRHSADPGMTVVSTSGSTSTAVPIPHNDECLTTGLGDNFGRAFIAAGVRLPSRPWLIGHWHEGHDDPSVAITGSFLSMAWLAALQPSTLLRNGTTPSLKLVREAAGAHPDVVASSPNLLSTLARTALEASLDLTIEALLYGGAAATDLQRQLWRDAFDPSRIIAFYPTTDAGAVGVSPDDDGTYLTFSETHLVEVVDQQGVQVEQGKRGRLAVTAFHARATPIIRYCVGDEVTFEGVHRNRVVVSDIQRSTDVPLGDTLIPLETIGTWSLALADQGFRIAGVQLVCRRDDLGRDVPVVVVRTVDRSAFLVQAAKRLVHSLPQVDHEIREGSIAPPVVEIDASPAGDEFKVPLFRDER